MDTEEGSLLSPISVEGFTLNEGWSPPLPLKTVNHTALSSGGNRMSLTMSRRLIFFFFCFFSINPAEAQIHPQTPLLLLPSCIFQSLNYLCCALTEREFCGNEGRRSFTEVISSP